MRNKFDEEVLVLNSKIISEYFGKLAIFNKDADFIASFVQLICLKYQFLKRSSAENDSNYKQIIPYVIFRYADKYFCMQRKQAHSEVRLSNKYSLGIGGHINKNDFDVEAAVKKNKTVLEIVLDWAKREFSEEVNYSGNYSVEFLGILNDTSNFVGEVHCGLVLLFTGDSAEISVKDEHKSGKLLDMEAIISKNDNLENWSKIIIENCL